MLGHIHIYFCFNTLPQGKGLIRIGGRSAKALAMTHRRLHDFHFGQLTLPSMLATALLVISPAWSQNAQNTSTAQRDESTATGVVVSSTRDTLVVRSDTGDYTLFVFDSNTVRPRGVTAGSTVRVVSVPGDDTDTRLARQITVVSAAPAAGTATTQTEPVVPPEIRRVERDIRRQARRYHVGVRAGVALDPELILIGVHAQVGPFFSSNVYFRPNVEFAYGEVTALFALNPEVIYQLPLASRRSRWAPYVGVGPGFSFVHQNFQRNTGGSRIDFGDFSSSVGLNILGGVRSRGGMFAEFKTSVYASPAPVLRLLIGYNF